MSVSIPAPTSANLPRVGELPQSQARLLCWTREVGHRYRVPARSWVLRQGAPARDVLLIESGKALLRRMEGNGAEVSVALCEPGSLLGLVSVVHGGPHVVSALMKATGDVIAVPADRIAGAFACPELRPALLDQLATQHVSLIRRYAARTALSAREQILKLLSEKTAHATTFLALPV